MMKMEQNALGTERNALGTERNVLGTNKSFGNRNGNGTKRFINRTLW